MSKKLTIRPNVTYNCLLPWVVWDNLFSEDELSRIEDYCIRQGVEPAKIFGKNDTDIIDTDLRSTNVNMHFPNDETYWFFEKFLGVAEHINTQCYDFDLLGFDQFQYAEYVPPNGNYGAHMDAMLGEHNLKLPRKLSFSLCLSDPSEYEGGELEFLIDGTGYQKVEQCRGRLVAFPSFMMHRVTPVTLGKRKSIVVWVQGPKFK